MPKLQFSGIYKTAKEIPPKQLLEYYLKGDQAERREAGNEILRRLDALPILEKTENKMGDLALTREEIIGLYESGGFLAEYAPIHIWWRHAPGYEPIYEPGGPLLVRIIEPEVPHQMVEDGELEIDYGGTFTEMYIYKLSDDTVLRAADYGPDEVGTQMKDAAEKALARVKVNVDKG